MKIYREIEAKQIPFGVIFGFIFVIIVGIGFGVYLWRKNTGKVHDVEALSAANLVLNKLSQHRIYHFSIQQMQIYAISKLSISDSTWKTAMRYIEESDYIESIGEDYDGQIRMCWKWKAPVPFLPLQQ